ncbi:ACT domain-containing protein [Aspergillus karnatakaensis]|uniref:ACT domain-containing protein n=1 Tax=Aspergillus karnatakaensis TaxID=1810916 RepID=UPI003CCE06A2
MSPPPTGETSLPTLLSTLHPILHSETYIFLTLPSPTQQTLESLSPEMILKESEGTTIITTPSLALSAGLTESDYIFPCKKISLKVHSSLEAVGLIATISNALAEKKVSSNVVSGFFHDHVFVPVGKEGVAMGVLESVMEKAKRELEQEGKQSA